MSTYARHRGVIVPLVTPVTAHGDLDEAAAARLVDHLARNGCGMLVLGTTGEVASLPTATRRRYVEIAVKIAAGRTPVFAGVVFNSLANSIAAGRDYLQLGVDAVVGLLPNYFKLEPVEMLGYFTQLAAGLPGPLLVYNMPVTTGMSIPVEIIEQLSRVPNITGLKDSEGTAGRREEVFARLGRRADFSLFMGIAANSVAALKLGFVGLVPSSGNLYPERWSELYAAATSSNWTRAEELQRQLDAIGGVFQRNRTLGPSLAALKAGLATRNLCGPHMVSPLRALPESEQLAVREEINRLG
ncbi:dihydrodipicolinate synthase family protein [Oleiharenicola lentus]|uniref:dihydrodipicolinate synthase family protein n=1 Tax=Oleiharenicola lentus TaxID=2508720 RepID=UPI003F681601